MPNMNKEKRTSVASDPLSVNSDLSVRIEQDSQGFDSVGQGVDAHQEAQPVRRLVSGNSAPESSHSGIRNRLMMPWKACVESMGQAMAKPSAVNANETRKIDEHDEQN